MDANWLTMAGQMAVLAQEGGAESATSGALGGAATGADGSNGAGTQGQPTGGGGMQMMMLILVPVMLFLILSSMMGGRKEKKKREQMMAALKKHDKVQTIGGVIGRVMEVGPEEVVLQVHEANKTRVTFSKSAIQQVLKSGSGGASGGGGGDGAESTEAAANGTVEKAGV